LIFIRTIYLYLTIKDTTAAISQFRELRIDHFHSGLDIKTQGVTGKEVVAAADGYIYRISVSPVGFGNSIHIAHPSGYSTVYGHLERFSDKIQKYVREQQYAKKASPSFCCLKKMSFLSGRVN